MAERTFTTHDIARFCDVAPSSVVYWINSGKLKPSYSTPGGHHRVTREDLLVFLREFNIPVPQELSAGEKKILIVDDDVEVTRVLQRAFARLSDSFRIETCHNGVEALIRIGQEPPHLVVLDIVLPKMDGLQVCRVLKSKAETRDVKIVAISGRKDPFGGKKPGDVSVDLFFKKPLDVLQLVAASAELVGLKAGPAASK